MSMKLSYLATYFEPDEALSVIAFLDQLRELLVNAYAAQIAADRRQQLAAREEQMEFDFGEGEPF